MKKFIAIASAALVSITSANAEQVWLTMDQVRPFKLKTPASSIIVGNPAIADVRIQDNSNVLLFGKAPGLTNMYVFDDQGETISNLIIRVRSQNTDMLTFYRGSSRTTYNCTSNCEATVTVGDDPSVFSGVSSQVQAKFKQAAGAAKGGENEE